MAKFNASYNEYLQSSIGATGNFLGNSLLLARVTHVIQGPFYLGTTIPDPFYTDPISLGNIAFQIINSTQYGSLAEAGNAIAKPIFAAFKQYPVEGEIVYVIPGPSVDMNQSRGTREFYYLPPYNLWGNSHHNAFPDLADVQGYASNAVDRTYQQSLATNQPANTGTTGSTVFPLGPNFVEKNNIKTLRQFTGDVTLEGRWGNSIRLGSTSIEVPGIESQNNWSQGSEPGNPITIIRNGQGRPADNIPWIPTVENINRDPSSIYLTQGQKIVIDDIQRNFSLASLQVKLETTQTVVIPIQQQLTSTVTTSAAQQDAVAKEITDTRAQSPTAEQTITPSTPVPSNLTPSSQPVVRVVGDYQDLSSTGGGYVVSLRAVDSNGNILSSTSATGTTALGTYQSAVSQIRSKNPNTQLIIPTLTSLIN
jgi:hypothetical protein